MLPLIIGGPAAAPGPGAGPGVSDLAAEAGVVRPASEIEDAELASAADQARAAGGA